MRATGSSLPGMESSLLICAPRCIHTIGMFLGSLRAVPMACRGCPLSPLLGQRVHFRHLPAFPENESHLLLFLAGAGGVLLFS